MLPADGYAWWYIDALSDDGADALTIIAFIGSVFSPYYAWARGRGPANPRNHCAMNIALYSRRAKLWAMTERSEARLENDAEYLAIGKSTMRWTGSSLELKLNEISAPIPRHITGEVKLFPAGLCEGSISLDAAGQHQWRPYAPCARVEVSLEQPRLKWRGSGYFDSNTGEAPLEKSFERWHWSRSVEPERCLLLYDVEQRGGTAQSLSLAVRANGHTEAIASPPVAPLPKSRWRVVRQTRADAGLRPRVVKTLEDGPFYARSLLQVRVLGEDVPVLHESLDLDRFSRNWVQCLLPFRMPRVR